jgi:hypothetical protein
MKEYKPLVLKDGVIHQLPSGDYISGDEKNVPQRKEIDFVGDTVIYKGWAVPGALTSQAVWKIQRIEFVGADKDVVYTWAGVTSNEANYDQIWDDRASLTYS